MVLQTTTEGKGESADSLDLLDLGLICYYWLPGSQVPKRVILRDF
jgi:hypothetical protein